MAGIATRKLRTSPPKLIKNSVRARPVLLLKKMLLTPPRQSKARNTKTRRSKPLADHFR